MRMIQSESNYVIRVAGLALHLMDFASARPHLLHRFQFHLISDLISCSAL